MKLTLNLTVFVAIAMFALEASSPAQPATRPATEPATPRDALRAYDHALPAGGLDAAVSAYHTTNDREAKAAVAMAKADLAGAKLERLARRKFGDDAANELIRAMRQTSPAELESAQLQMQGDTATIVWTDDREPLKMVKVDGKWKVSVADLVGDDDDSLTELVETNEAVAKEFDRTAKELEAGDYPNPNLLERAVKQRMFRVLGEDD